MANWRSATSRPVARIVMTAVVAATASSVWLRAAATLGGGVTINETTPLAAVLEKPESYAGKTIAVEGVVTAVCTEMGCWMALAPTEKSEKALLIQVAHDGVVVFPMSAKGKRATAQGTVERNGRHGQAAAKEHAEHRGDREPEAVAGWQIQATGAVLQ